MNKNDLIRLQHMLDASREARLFLADRQKSDIYHNRMLEHTFIRLVTVIGEAASKISQETREQIPELNWVDIIKMRNKLVHDYMNINLSILWDTIEINLPELIEVLEKIPDLS